MAGQEDNDLEVVPIPSSETQEEHDRVRRSNDRDQAMERNGETSRHNEGYDEVADLTRKGSPVLDRIVDE